MLDLFDQMPLMPDAVTFTILFNACAQLANERAKQRGKEVLASLPQALRADARLMTSVIDMLMKFGEIGDAEQAFQSVKTRTGFMLGAMMQGERTVFDLGLRSIFFR